MSPQPGLGANWLAAHGAGRIDSSDREALKKQLLLELSSKDHGPLPPTVVEDELQRFLDSGRVSDSNLNRLERRILARCGAGAVSGAMSARSAAGHSDFSRASVGTPGSMSARSTRLPTLSTGADHLTSVQEEEVPVQKWSQLARFWKTKEEVDKANAVAKSRNQQKKMRDELQEQIEVKTKQKQAKQEEEKRQYERAIQEVERWKKEEEKKEARQRERALKEKQEREEQHMTILQRREKENEAKAREERALVERAADALQKEKQEQAAKKLASRLQQRAMMEESVQGKGDPKQRRKEQYEDELRKVDEYTMMLAEQEQRNRPIIGKIRGENAPIVAGQRRGQEFYTEEALARQRLEANEAAEVKEREKIRRIRDQKAQNQDFLFQQIAERNRLRDHDMEQKRQQKLRTEAAMEEHAEAERMRNEAIRTKNAMYRSELDRQVAERQAQIKPKSWEDSMTPAEKAINQHLIKEAQELQRVRINQ